MECFTKFQNFLLIYLLRISVIGCACEFWKETHTQTYIQRSPSFGTRAKTIKATKCGKQACSSVGWYSVFKSFWHLFFSPGGRSGKHQGRTAVALNQNMPLFLGLQSRLFAFPNRGLGGSLQCYKDSFCTAVPYVQASLLSFSPCIF